MSQVKVWNDNVHPFSQKFKGEIINIPAKSFIEMDWDDAMQFKSKGSPMAFDGMNNQKPESYKMLRIEGRPSLEDRVIMYKCHLDGSIHATKDALEAHVKSLSSEVFADEEVVKTRKKG